MCHCESWECSSTGDGGGTGRESGHGVRVENGYVNRGTRHRRKA